MNLHPDRAPEHSGSEPARLQILLLASITLAVAFCSMIYELLLAETLSLLLGQTLLRYTTTIGTYLFALGMGALLAARYDPKTSLGRLIQIEVALSCVALLLPLLVFMGEGFFRGNVTHGQLGQSIYLYGLVLLIGLLSGFEIPILMQLARQKISERCSDLVLALDYLGTFIAAICFPLGLYSYLGFVATASTAAFVNIFAALGLLSLHESSKHRRFTIVLLAFLAAGAISLWHFEETVRHLLSQTFVN